MKNDKDKNINTLQKFMEQFRLAAEKIMESLQYIVDTGEKPKWTEGWKIGLQHPYCPATERYYTGANALMLELANIIKGYEDNRWLTFNQLETFRQKHSDAKMHVRKGEKGTTLLRPEILHFIMEENENGETSWKLLSSKELKELEERKNKGEDIPQIFRKIQYKSFTVFNAKQIEGFPEKEIFENKDINRPNAIECFIACSGIALDYNKNNTPLYRVKNNIILMPSPNCFLDNRELTATLLHEYFHATGHESRENRLDAIQKDSAKYALEEMKAESFALLAGLMLDVPFTPKNSLAYLASWRKMLTETDDKNLYAIFSQSAHLLETLQGFLRGENDAPRPKWFPPMETWQTLCQEQDQRNEENLVNDINLQETLASIFPELKEEQKQRMTL